MYGGPIRSHQRSFGRYHPDPLCPPFLEIGGLQLSYPLLSHEQVKLRTSNMVQSEQMPVKNFAENGAWAYPGTAQFLWVPPIISGMDKVRDFRFGEYICMANPNKSPLKILQKMERGRIQGLPKYFGYPLLSQERVKLRTSNFVSTFIESIRTKAHEQCWE